MCATPTDTGTPIPDNALAVRRSITIDRPAGELHALWLTPDAQRLVMGHMAEVTPGQTGTWHWKAHVPIFGDLEWDSRVIVNDPPSRIVWQSVDGAELPNRGELEFLEAGRGRGTEVQLTWRFDPPAGKLGDLIAKLSHAPQAATSVALRRFKSLAETGEVPSLTGNPAARDDPDPYGAFE